jgi:hypothetical protein
MTIDPSKTTARELGERRSSLVTFQAMKILREPIAGPRLIGGIVAALPGAGLAAGSGANAAVGWLLLVAGVTCLVWHFRALGRQKRTGAEIQVYDHGFMLFRSTGTAAFIPFEHLKRGSIQQWDDSGLTQRPGTWSIQIKLDGLTGVEVVTHAQHELDPEQMVAGCVSSLFGVWAEHILRRLNQGGSLSGDGWSLDATTFRYNKLQDSIPTADLSNTTFDYSIILLYQRGRDVPVWGLTTHGWNNMLLRAVIAKRARARVVAPAAESGAAERRVGHAAPL